VTSHDAQQHRTPQVEGPQVDIAYAEPTEDDPVIATFKYHQPGADWSASGQLTRGATGLVISALTLHPGGDSGVTGALMRRVQVGEMLSAIRTKMLGDTLERAAERGDVKFVAMKDHVTPRSGRTPLTDELLRDVALAYLHETAPGMPAGALRRMAVQFERPEETLRTWVGRARRDGWLGPSVKGRSGAEPGDRLIEEWFRTGLKPDAE
jgi:hypothetical protein